MLKICLKRTTVVNQSKFSKATVLAWHVFRGLKVEHGVSLDFRNRGCIKIKTNIMVAMEAGKKI